MKFLQQFKRSLGCAALCLWAAAAAAGTAEAQDYDLLLFSDLHYDRIDLHRPDPKRPFLKEQTRRYSTLWQTEMPRILAAAGRKKFAFPILLGDNVEGYFYPPEALAVAMDELHKLMKVHVASDYKAVIGNHEYPKTTRAVFEKKAAELGIADSCNFTFRHGGDLFIVWDNIAPRLKFLQDALAQAQGARRIFLLCHLPVLPVGGTSPRWIAFGRPDQDADRKALLALLARHNVIVLCGHFHRFALSEYAAPEGRITQLMLNSIMDRTAWQTPTALAMSKEFPFFTESDFNRNKNPEELRAFLKDYVPFLKESRQFAAYGYAVLHVTQDAVTADLYSRTDDKPFAVWKLR